MNGPVYKYRHVLLHMIHIFTMLYVLPYCILLVMYIYIFVFHLNILFMYNKCIINKITIIVSHILSIFYFNIIFPSCNNCNYTVKLFFVQPCLQRHISSGTSRISYLFGICNYFMDIDLFKFTFNCFQILS